MNRSTLISAVSFSFLACGVIWAGEPTSAPPTFTKDVAPILYKNCVSCHRTGEIAPMALLTYQEARPWAKSIREKVTEGLMPPWHATQPKGTFLNDRRLSDLDKDTLVHWVDAGAPQGDPKDLPPQPEFAEGWQIGTPDVVLTMPKPFKVTAAGTIAYQYFTVPTNFTEDKWVQAIEVRPGTRSVVHHVLVFERVKGVRPPPPAFLAVIPKLPPPTDPNDHSQEGQLGPGTLIATTAPGTNAMIYEPGQAMKVSAGSELIFQVHYTANGKEATDQSSVGMVFAKEPPKIVRKVPVSRSIRKVPQPLRSLSIPERKIWPPDRETVRCQIVPSPADPGTKLWRAGLNSILVMPSNERSAFCT